MQVCIFHACMRARARCPCAHRFFALFRGARFTIVSIIIIVVVTIIVIIIVISIVVIIIIILILIIIITTTIMHTPTPLHIERHACAPQHERRITWASWPAA